MNKQIEEMAFNLIMATSPLGVKDLTKQFDYETVAKDLYELYGWRKQVEGEWFIPEYEYLACSECGEYYYTGCDSTAEAKGRLADGICPNYCPNCGAKMKGGE